MSIGPTLGDIIALNDMFHDAALLHAAVEQRLFDQLTAPAPAARVAGELGWVERKTRIMLDALVALGLLTKDGDDFVNTENTTRYLTSTSEAYVGAIIDHQRLQWPLWRRMGEVLSSDGAVEAQQEVRLKKDDAANAAFNKAMVQLSRDNVADVLTLPDFAHTGRVLDLCGGHGSYLAALAQKHPDLRGEVWDYSSAEELARQTFADHGVADQLEFRACNMLDPDVFDGASADACMLNDCLHYFDEAETRTLIEKVASIVPQGGLLVIMTMTLDADRITPPSAAGFSLHMMLNTNHGGLHPTPWIRGVMDDAGFEVERKPLGSLGRYTMLAGRKR